MRAHLKAQPRDIGWAAAKQRFVKALEITEALAAQRAAADRALRHSVSETEMRSARQRAIDARTGTVQARQQQAAAERDHQDAVRVAAGWQAEADAIRATWERHELARASGRRRDLRQGTQCPAVAGRRSIAATRPSGLRRAV